MPVVLVTSKERKVERPLENQLLKELLKKSTVKARVPNVVTRRRLQPPRKLLKEKLLKEKFQLKVLPPKLRSQLLNVL